MQNIGKNEKRAKTEKRGKGVHKSYPKVITRRRAFALLALKRENMILGLINFYAYKYVILDLFWPLFCWLDELNAAVIL